MQDVHIGAVIGRVRRERSLTQEQLGTAIGVTAGAVSKWETGSALPDITLLAPLARALEISLDTLLAYESEPPADRLAALQKNITEAFLQQGPEAGRAALRAALRQYPNSTALKAGGAVLLKDSAGKAGDAAGLLAEALALFQQVLDSGGTQYRLVAVVGTADIYLAQGRWDECRACLGQLDGDGRSYSTLVYPRLLLEQGKAQEAEAFCQSQLETLLADAHVLLGHLEGAARQQGSAAGAGAFLEKQRVLEQYFGIGIPQP